MSKQTSFPSPGTETNLVRFDADGSGEFRTIGRGLCYADALAFVIDHRLDDPGTRYALTTPDGEIVSETEVVDRAVYVYRPTRKPVGHVRAFKRRGGYGFRAIRNGRTVGPVFESWDGAEAAVIADHNREHRSA